MGLKCFHQVRICCLISFQEWRLQICLLGKFKMLWGFWSYLWNIF
jgi:hypothetical protein